MPANDKGVHIDPTDWNRADGFSPGSTICSTSLGLQKEQAFREGVWTSARS